MMNKVELAKMLGLEYYYGYSVDKYTLADCIFYDCEIIHWEFCNSKIVVSVCQEDFTKDKLDIKLSDLEREEDIKTCIKQVEDLLWERAADRYLEMVHNAAMMIGE